MSDALPIIVSAWPKNSREELRVSLTEYQGQKLIDVRTWYAGADGELKPGKGLAASVRHLRALASAIAEAERIAGERGLLNEGGA